MLSLLVLVYPSNWRQIFCLVKIDDIGVYKYIQIKCTDPSTNISKIIIRGCEQADYHADVLEIEQPGLEALGLKGSLLDLKIMEIDASSSVHRWRAHTKNAKRMHCLRLFHWLRPARSFDSCQSDWRSLSRVESRLERRWILITVVALFDFPWPVNFIFILLLN